MKSLCMEANCRIKHYALWITLLKESSTLSVIKWCNKMGNDNYHQGARSHNTEEKPCFLYVSQKDNSENIISLPGFSSSISTNKL